MIQAMSSNNDPVRRAYLKSVMRCITRCYMPFSFFDEPCAVDLVQRPNNLYINPTITSTTAPIYLKELTDEIIKVINDRVNEKKVCLKLDYIEQQKFAVLSINIMYIFNYEFHTHMIGALELNDPNVNGNLNALLWKNLRDFNIDKSQVYCIVLANGEHTMKSTKVRNVLQEVGINDNVQFEGVYNYERVYNELSEKMPIIPHIPDAMEIIANKVYIHFKADIEEFKQNIKTIYVDLDVEMLVEENMPSWYTTYELMKDVALLMSTEDSKLLLKLNQDFIKNYCTTFDAIVKHINCICTMKCIGDFYREWLVCEFALESICAWNSVAQMALPLMEEHKKEFFQNNKFLAALYMDPRFTNKCKTFLNDEQQFSAIEILTRIYYELKNLKRITLTAINTNNESDKYNVLYTEPVKQNTQDVIDETIIQNLFNAFKLREPLAFKEDVLYYFLKLENPVMQKFAEVVLLSPVWQTTMENAYNTLPFIAKRTNLMYTPEDLKRILLLKFNSELI